MNDKVLRVGEELFKETLPIRNGARLYHLQGLKPQTWYEVKMSYPASVCCPTCKRVPLYSCARMFTILVFFLVYGDMSVLVNVEPEGVVAIPGKQEMEHIMFNIVCDELLLGIPHKAWYVAVFVLIGLVLAFVVPWYLPAFLLPKNGRQPLLDHTVTKAS
ncbi:hypothetical protein SASPL_150917 [Salvia splendens]|uniref:Uncharacterized protein n=1 Tax=Salvia splendens TaxID=180675 RepID=A0A8X8W7R7_SALSN|nr:hypothetical protein SASPL_150917 [Salvia splendens]